MLKKWWKTGCPVEEEMNTHGKKAHLKSLSFNAAIYFYYTKSSDSSSSPKIENQDKNVLELMEISMFKKKEKTQVVTYREKWTRTEKTKKRIWNHLFHSGQSTLTTRSVMTIRQPYKPKIKIIQIEVKYRKKSRNWFLNKIICERK